MSLTSHTKQALIAKAHSLHPIVIIGNDGLTQGVLLEIDRALRDHELIKIRLPGGDKSEKTELIQSIAKELGADSLKLIGHIVILYRKSDKAKKEKKSGMKKSGKSRLGKKPNKKSDKKDNNKKPGKKSTSKLQKSKR